MKLAGTKILSAWLCLYRCPDQSRASRPATRVWNLTDRPIELQIRVGSILKKGHTLKPGSCRRLRCKAIYKSYVPRSAGGGLYHDEMCQPYVWINDCLSDVARSRVVKQQYVSLEDLRDSSEIRVLRDHHRGCISVQKKPRPDFC